MLLCFIHSFSVAEVQAIASMIEKQAQIVVKHKEVSEESKKRKEALLAQYANITDEEEYPFICKPSAPRFTSLTDVSDRSHEYFHEKKANVSCCLIQSLFPFSHDNLRFLDSSTEAEEEEPTSGSNCVGNDKCILFKKPFMTTI